MSKKERLRFLMLEKIDNFLNSHELKVKLPKEIVTGEVFPFVPKYFFDSVPEELTVPLSDEKNTPEGKEVFPLFNLCFNKCPFTGLLIF